MTATTKIIKNGASQAVRLPKEFRFDVDEVCIKRIGSAILLFPANAAWDLMAHAIDNFDDDVLVDRNQPKRSDARKTLDKPKGKRS